MRCHWTTNKIHATQTYHAHVTIEHRFVAKRLFTGNAESRRSFFGWSLSNPVNQGLVSFQSGSPSERFPALLADVGVALVGLTPRLRRLALQRRWITLARGFVSLQIRETRDFFPTKLRKYI